MKIAIPLAEGKLTTHFGHCKNFALITVRANACPKFDQQIVEPPPHEPGLLPVWLHQQGVTHVIAGGLGQRARTLLEEKGITVMVGAASNDPVALVHQFLSNTLILGVNGCDH